ncbi:MAG: C25 family cysteine peptidase [Candidatus Zixiibacteriota bacterium]
MRKINILFILLFLQLVVFAAPLEIDIEFDKNDFIISDSQTSIEGYYGSGTLDHLDGVPVVSFNILLPPNSRITNLAIYATDRKVLSENQIMGIEETPLDKWTNTNFFSLPEKEFVEVANQGFLIGKSIATIAVYPFSQKTSGTFLAENIKIVYSTKRTDQKPILPLVQTENTFKGQMAVITNSVINPEYIDKYEEVTSIYPLHDLYSGDMSASLPPANGDSPVDFLIITSDTLKESYEKFMFENHSGNITRIFTVEEIQRHYHGGDMQVQIRKFLKDAYQYWGIGGIMFGGDWRDVPVRFMSLRMNTSLYRTASDIYYASLDGTLNYDGDHIYGEDDSFDDIYPELFVGRIPINDPEKIDIYFDKCIMHRYALPEDFAGRWLFLGASLHGGEDYTGAAHKNIIIESTEYDIHPSIDIYKLYTSVSFDISDGDEILTEESTVRGINDQRYLINHIDHGDRSVLWTGLKTGGGGLFIPEIDALENAPYFPVLYSFSCDVNSLDNENVAQHWLENPDGGGVAFFGNHDKAWSLQINMDYEFFKTFMVNWVENLGIVNQIHRNNIMTRRYSPGIIGLTGYPMLNPYMTDPLRLDITAASPEIGDTMISVSVEDNRGNPVVGATVVISNQNYDMRKAITDHEGMADIKFHFRESIEHYASCIKSGYVADQDSMMPVESSDYFSIVSRLRFIEETGLLNNTPEAGETGKIELTIKNISEGLIEDGYIILKLNSESMPYDTIYYEDLAASDSLTMESSSFFIDSLLKGRKNLLPVAIYDYGISDTFSMVSIGGDLETMKFDFDDDENGLPDSGDTAVVKIKLYNNETTIITHLNMELSIDTGFVIIPVDDFEDTVSAFDSTVFEFEIYENSLPFGAEPLFSTRIYDNLGREWSFDFNPDVVFPPDSIWMDNSENYIELFWTPQEGALGYNIYRSSNPDSNFSRQNLFPVWGSRYKDEPLMPRTDYYYRVTTLDSSFNESDFSETIKAWTSLRLMDGWPILTKSGNRLNATAVVGDINHNGFKEVFVAGWDGAIYGFDYRGQDLRDSTIGVDPFYTIETYTGAPHGGGHIWNALVMDDIDNDGYLDILFPTRIEHRIYAIDKDGNDLPGWPQESPSSFFITPTAANIDDDPYSEIIALDVSYRLYVWNHDGTPFGDSAVFAVLHDPDDASMFGASPPSVGDLNNDGIKEIIVGGEYEESGRIYAVQADGESLEGFPISLDSISGSTFCDNSPAIGNIDDDSSTLEIIISARRAGICAFDHNGNFIEGFPNMMPTFTSPAIADVDGDGKVEIFAAGEYQFSLIDDDGSDFPGWPIPAPAITYSNPVISDIDANGVVDFIIAVGQKIYVYDIYGNQVPGYPLLTGHDNLASPSIDDINNDGTMEIIQPCYDSRVYIWETGNEIERNPWKTFGGNYMRTGCLNDSLREAINQNPIDVPEEFEYIYAVPNPFNSKCQLNIPEEALTEIYDIRGQRLSEASYKIIPNGENIILELENNPKSGLYVIRAIHKDKTYLGKLIYIE